MSDLPTGWVNARLGDLVTHIVGGGTPSKANASYFQGAIPFMTVKDMHSRFIEDTQDHITQEALDESASTMIPTDTLIVASRMSLGKIARPKQATAINQDLKALFLHQGIDKTYVEYAWRANEGLIQSMGTGTTVKGIRLEDIRSLQVPLAPSEEQTRIANQLDTLLARINACQRRLDNIPALLKRFRQAVLDAATTGALIEDWQTCDVTQWPTVSLGAHASDFSYGTAAKSEKSGRVPVLRMGNIQGGRLDWTNLVYTSNEAEIKKYELRTGDVLFNRTNSPELVGKTAVYLGERSAIYAGYLIRVRCKEGLLPEYLNYCLGSTAGRDFCWAVKSDGVSQSNINAKKLRDFRFLLPTLTEQREIVRRAESFFRLADRIEAHYTAMRVYVLRLGPQVLAKAFRGELMPQDPSDEPASVLLAKLKTGRASAETTPARKRSKATREQPKMSNVDQNYIKTVILRIGTDRFSFDELRTHTAGDYESLKAALFALLEEPNPVVRQVYDEDAKAMRLVRVKP